MSRLSNLEYKENQSNPNSVLELSRVTLEELSQLEILKKQTSPINTPHI